MVIIPPAFGFLSRSEFQANACLRRFEHAEAEPASGNAAGEIPEMVASGAHTVRFATRLRQSEFLIRVNSRLSTRRRKPLARHSRARLAEIQQLGFDSSTDSGHKALGDQPSGS
ncbi:MAG: hypothetical protein JSS59_04000 [Proteobacteria bacterium]|uniref:hypothetical protein n=1 Tax=Rudaea sp. TaxID=2136325 RepID=UPI00378307F6|nr:hypothetical protein [Pseudomonadota bacterium]